MTGFTLKSMGAGAQHPCFYFQYSASPSRHFPEFPDIKVESSDAYPPCLVPQAGIEPTTLALGVLCSIR